MKTMIMPVEVVMKTNNSAGGGDDNNDENINQYKITASHLCVINRACNTLFI